MGRLVLLVVCTGLLGCAPHIHLFESPAPVALDARQVEWQKQVTDLLNEYDRRIKALEDRAADGQRT